MATPIIYSRDELDLIVELACSLDEKPGTNWVQDAGGLPEYICQIAQDIHQERGKTVSQAIAIAVSRVKKWATGAGANAATQAKATKAVTEWEALRAKSHAKTAAKKTGKAALTAGTGRAVLCLSDYNMDDVRSAFNARVNQLQADWRKANPNGYYTEGPASLYVREVWNTFLIVASEYGKDGDLYKVPYTVADNGDVSFGDAVEVKTQYVVIDEGSADDVGADVSDELISQVTAMTHTGRVLAAAAHRHSAVDTLLALCPDCGGTCGDTPGVAGTAVATPTHADPGHQADGKPRYQLNTAKQVKAAWAMVNQTLNGRKYEPWQLAHIKANIEAAAKKHDVDLTALSAAVDAFPAVGRLLALSAVDDTTAGRPM